MTHLAIKLPWPPSVNHYWRKGPKGMYISDEGKNYRATVCRYMAANNIKIGRAHV